MAAMEGWTSTADHFCQIWQSAPCEMGFISPTFFAPGRNVDRHCFSITTCPCFDIPISYVLFAGLFAFKWCCFLEVFLIYMYLYSNFLVHWDFWWISKYTGFVYIQTEFNFEIFKSFSKFSSDIKFYNVASPVFGYNMGGHCAFPLWLTISPLHRFGQNVMFQNWNFWDAH